MKIAEAAGLASLRESGLRGRFRDEERTALELAKDIFAEAEEREQPFLYHTPETWTKKWLPSRRFKLVRLPLNAAAMPCEPKIDNLVLKKIHAMEQKPIIVDYNRNQVGKSMHGFVPQVIVIDGKHRFKAATLRGETHIMAWVGDVALPMIHAFGSGGGPKEVDPAPGARLNAVGKGSMQEATLSKNIGNTYSGTAKKLKTLNVKRLLSEYQHDVEAGRISAAGAEVQASAPPGCEDMVKGLKDSSVDNPFAVAWWHYNKYGSCGGNGKGK